MAWDENSESVCPIARGLSIFGDRWTLLIMREIGMEVRRFEDIQAQTGMSPNLLTMRLKRLEEDGLIERRQYGERRDRFEYYATEKGKELDAVLLAIRAWGQRWGGFEEDAEPSVNMVYKATGEVIDVRWQVPRKGFPFSFDDVECAISEAFLAEREARATAFRAGRRKSAAKGTGKPITAKKNAASTAATKPAKKTAASKAAKKSPATGAGAKTARPAKTPKRARLVKTTKAAR